ncbi:Concanavalin A-like lectin/glucanase domain,Galectin, carbohydrate recognition domain [Cinara cedri]|uniref:Galectin n=1 Tax=Cinara cedri TaxID=506608 RepID=A0A5E4N971_9HEMI|nr:Concanavalin A-like lectin/glucanase domain,Galectin, carbohydrate recognition domain [Cinara cedri]
MAQARFLNPIMPFMGAVLSGSEEGSVVRIHGSSFWTSNKICIYFQTDSEVEPRDDVALYIALDFNRNLIIRNSMMAQIWGLEETQGPPVSLVRGQPFNLDIICDVNNYKILFNGVFHAEMKHRIPCINDFYLVVDGDALLYSVQINDIGLALPGQIPIPSHLLLPEQMQYLSEEMPIPEQMHLPEEMPIPEQMHLPEEMAILEQMDFSEEMPLLEQMHYLSEDMPIPEQIHLSEEMPIPQQMIYLSEEMPGLPGQISKPTMFMCVPAGVKLGDQSQGAVLIINECHAFELPIPGILKDSTSWIPKSHMTIKIKFESLRKKIKPNSNFEGGIPTIKFDQCPFVNVSKQRDSFNCGIFILYYTFTIMSKSHFNIEFNFHDYRDTLKRHLLLNSEDIT